MQKCERRHPLRRLEKIHEKNEKDLLELLISKLQTLLKDKPSAGVSNNFGEVLIGKGAKFNAKNLSQYRLSKRKSIGMDW